MTITWGKLSDLVNNGKALSLDSALFFVFSQDDIQLYAIELNTGSPNNSEYGQLFLNGVDANDVSLESIGGEYAPFTKDIKTFLGLPIDRVTLYQTGEFYRSWEFVNKKDGFILRADPMKEGEDLTDRWGEAIIGLTDESISKLNIEILPRVIDYILSALLS
jgi:hypothetical protein